MNRTDFQMLSRLRLREARVLLDRGLTPGAYYLLGYVVECALKACICKQVEKHDFPDKELVKESWNHNLKRLLRAAGLEQKLNTAMKSNPTLSANWSIVKDWSETVRYNHWVSERRAKDLHSAITSRKHGVYPWLKKYW